MAEGPTHRALEAARFFLKQADASQSDRHAFGYFIEAAIVFGRTVTFRLQAEFAMAPGFRSWWDEQQVAMRANPLFSFFRDERNLVLKRRGVGFLRKVELGGAIEMSSAQA